MNLRHLKILCQVVDCSFNVSRAARALHTSQPSVSRHLHFVEDTLCADVFVRKGNRIVGLTSRGKQVLQLARTVMGEFEKIGLLGSNEDTDQSGQLTIAASHTHARYSLPKVITKFRQKYPQIKLVLRQGNANQVSRWVSTGAADVGISATPTDNSPNLLFLPCYEHHRIVLVPIGHPLLKRRRLRLAELSKYPLITYEPPLTFHAAVLQAFARKGLEANIVLSATDVDVMKTYVTSGLGVAIVASLGYDRRLDVSLRAIPADHLFKPTMINVTLRRRSYLRPYVYDFIHLFAPALKRESIAKRLAES